MRTQVFAVSFRVVGKKRKKRSTVVREGRGEGSGAEEQAGGEESRGRGTV